VGEGLGAGVCVEPGSTEFLAVSRNKLSAAELQLQDKHFVSELADRQGYEPHSKSKLLRVSPIAVYLNVFELYYPLFS